MTESAYPSAGRTGSAPSDEARNVGGAVGHGGREVADSARAGAGEVAAEARQQAAVLGDQAREHARHLVDEAGTQLRAHGDKEAGRAADGLAGVARQVEALVAGRPEEAGAVRDYAAQLGRRAQDVSERLQREGMDGVLGDVRRFARDRPGLFLAGAVAAGFAVGRLVRAQTSSGDDGDPHGARDAAGYADVPPPPGYGEPLPPPPSPPAQGRAAAPPVGDVGDVGAGRAGSTPGQSGAR